MNDGCWQRVGLGGHMHKNRHAFHQRPNIITPSSKYHLVLQIQLAHLLMQLVFGTFPAPLNLVRHPQLIGRSLVNGVESDKTPQ